MNKIEKFIQQLEEKYSTNELQCSKHIVKEKFLTSIHIKLETDKTVLFPSFIQWWEKAEPSGKE